MKRAEEAESGIFARGGAGPEAGGGLFESGTGADGRGPGGGGGSVWPRGRIAAFGKPAAIPAGIVAGTCRQNPGGHQTISQRAGAGPRLDYEIHFALGRALLESKDPSGAETEFRGALAQRADSAPARLGLANALQNQKKYEAASSAFAEYLKLKPEDRGAHFDRAFALLNLDRLDDALAELDLADKGASPTPESLKMRGEIYMQQMKWKEARETLTQALRLSSNDAETAYWLGHVDFELRDYPAAIGILSQVYDKNPQSADALRELASALFLHEEYAAALGAMDRLDKMETPKAGSWFVRAICYDKLSRKAEAVDAYQKFLDQDNGQHDNQDIEAQHRMVALQKELAKSGKNGKK